MGFYGNITNTARTQFQFDKVYPNRYSLEKHTIEDGIYTGRYVLVEYDTELELNDASNLFDSNTYIRVSVKPISGTDKYYIYLSTTGTDGAIQAKASDFDYGQIVYTAQSTESNTGITIKDCSFYIITTSPNEGTVPAMCTLVSDSHKINYTINYNIDLAYFSEQGRGYDSTVWQKTYIDGKEKYVMIAELNTVVPTFDVVPDAPEMGPIVPHFDTQSTDVYYKLHWQAPWGFRIAEANGEEQKLNTVSTKKYPTDQQATYIKTIYNPITGVEKEELVNYQGAIYFNKDGFNSQQRSKVEGLTDAIDIIPTGQSGNKYNAHDGTGILKEMPDILELSIILPSLGNTISDIWDIIYTIDRKQDIGWKLIENEQRSNMTDDVTSLAGCINSIHKLMGMIITANKPVIENLETEQVEAEYNKHYIYKENEHYYRLAKINIAVKEENAPAHYNSGTYNYEYIELESLGNNLSTIFGCILEIKELLGADLEKNVGEKIYDRSTLIGVLNSLNEIIDLFAPLSPSQFLIYNNSKKIKTAQCTTKQGMGWTNWGNNTKQSISEPDENKFIKVEVDGTDNTITIEHQFNKITDTTTTSDKNIDDDIDDTLQLYSPIVDNIGHVVGKNVETVTLPYGYKNITVGNSSAVINDIAHLENTQIATNTQDTITFKPSNKWIKMQGDSNKTISVSHEVHEFIDGEANTEYGLTSDKTISELDKNNTFEVPTFKFDEAGHITGARTHTITIPENFSTVAITNSGKDSIATVATASDADLVADTLIDTVIFDAGNRWITLVGNEGSDKVSIYHAAAGNQTNTTQIGNEEPNFGTTFKIPEVKYDEAGHVSGIATHTVKMPLPTLNDFEATNASVITGMTMDDSTGAITITHDNIGNRILTDYEIGTQNISLTNTDSINSAFGKLQYQLNTEVEDRQKAINDEKERAIAEEQKLNKTIEDESTRATEAEAELIQSITTEKERAEGIEATLQTNIDNEIIARKEAITKEISDREKAITDAINLLDVEEIVENGKYISAISQTDGKINGTLKSLPDYTEYWNKITLLENTIAQMQNTITDLTSRIEQLENSTESTE